MEKQSRETILFVDDEEAILDIVREFFQHKGYTVITAGNGLEALKILEAQNVNCCVTDINMPEMDGLELAERIRQIDMALPVIVMTGFPSLDATIHTLKNGVVDFLIKPVNLGQMEMCVRGVLHQRELFVENLLLKEEIRRKEQLEALNRELREKVEELDILNKIMGTFTGIRQSFDVFRSLTDLTTTLTRADTSRFYLINNVVEKPFEVTVSISQKFDLSVKKSELPYSIEQLIIESSANGMPILISKKSLKLPENIVSFMAVPMMIRGKIFGVLTASIHSGNIKFNNKDLYYLSFMTEAAAYSIENLALYENICDNLFSTLLAFVKALEARDFYTGRHAERVTIIAKMIAQKMGCSSEDLEILEVAGRLHDIGKIGIKDSILLKPGSLTDEEFAEIKKHPVIGADIVEQLGFWKREQEIIRSHHERFDGKGYPAGRKGEEIPFLSRVMFVADAYDAMCSHRCYRNGMNEAKIISIISERAGTQFDPDAVRTFLELYHDPAVYETLQKLYLTEACDQNSTIPRVP